MHLVNVLNPVSTSIVISLLFFTINPQFNLLLQTNQAVTLQTQGAGIYFYISDSPVSLRGHCKLHWLNDRIQLSILPLP